MADEKGGKLPKRYFILATNKKNPDASPSIFYDAASGLKILSRDKANPDPAASEDEQGNKVEAGYTGRETKKITSALKNGHIIEVDAPSTKSKGKVDPAKDLDTTKNVNIGDKELKDLTTTEELLAYYKANYEVKKKEEEEFLGMSLEEQKEFLAE